MVFQGIIAVGCIQVSFVQDRLEHLTANLDDRDGMPPGPRYGIASRL